MTTDQARNPAAGLQVIWQEGQPQYAVLPWADYQQLLQEAGRLPSGQAQAAGPSVAADPVPFSELARLREARNLSQQDLARELGISPSYMAMIERGERQPGDVHVRVLGRLLDVEQWQFDSPEDTVAP